MQPMCFTQLGAAAAVGNNLQFGAGLYLPFSQHVRIRFFDCTGWSQALRCQCACVQVILAMLSCWFYFVSTCVQVRHPLIHDRIVWVLVPCACPDSRSRPSSIWSRDLQGCAVCPGYFSCLACNTMWVALIVAVGYILLWRLVLSFVLLMSNIQVWSS